MTIVLGTANWSSSGIAPITQPTSDGGSILTVWERNGMRVEERLYFAHNADTGRMDTTAVDYTLRNNSSANVDAGLRIMLDVMVGENDGAPYFILGSGQVTRQSEWLGANVPNYWISYESPTFAADSLKGRGQLADGDATRPDRFVIADWPQAHGSVWEYNVNPADLVTNDSAVLLYFNPLTLGPGQTRTYRTYYGINRSGEVAQIELEGLEVTQAIQDLKNSVVLVQDKPTFVRAHVRSTSGNVANVTAELVGRRGGTELGAQQPVRGGSITVLERPSRATLEDSFLFELPTTWRSGTVELEFRGINRTIACTEPDNDGNSSNNNDCKVQVDFTASPEPDVRMVGIEWEENNTSHLPNQTHFEQAARQIQAAYPVPSLRWDSPYNIRPVFFAGRPDDAIEFIRLTSMLSTARSLDGCISIWPTNCTRYYLGIIIDPPNSAHVAGLGWPTPIDVAVAYLDNDLTIAHELGHGFGRSHTDYNRQRNLDPAETATGYHEPADGTISQTKEDFEADTAFGLDVFGASIYGPKSPDVMSYGSNVWPSAWTYSHLREYIANRNGISSTGITTGQLIVGSGDLALIIGGIVTPTLSTGKITSVYSEDSPVPVASPTPGAFAIRFENASAQQLSSFSFDPHLDSEGGSNGTYSLFLPWHADLARIVLMQDGRILDSRWASPHTPAITVLSPNGGELLTGNTVTIHWTANDADNDSLTYAIQYSTDAGSTWQTLVSDWTAPAYDLRLDTIAGTEQGMVRVLASDGFHTAQDQSDDVFRLDRHAPQVSIQPSAFNQLYVGSQVVVLEGSARDNESGKLTGDALIWSSNLDGQLGMGGSLSVDASSLREGTHIFTLTARDNDDQRASASLPVTIYHQRPDLPASLSTTPDSLSFDVIEGSVQADWQTIFIRNAGDGSLDWMASADRPWIRISSISGSAPTDILVTAVATGLAPGQYTGTLTVSTSASDSPRQISVFLGVRAQLVPRAFMPLAMRSHRQSPPDNWLAAAGLTGRTVLQLTSTNPTCSTVFASTDRGAYRSYDGGKSWAPIFANAAANMLVRAFDGQLHPNASLIPAITQCSTNLSILYLTTWGDGVYRSTDAGSSWQPRNGGLSDTWLYDLGIGSGDCSTVYAAANSGGVFKTTDGGGYWQAINNGLGNLSTRSVVLAPANPNWLWVGTTSGVYRSENGGASWQGGAGLPGEMVGVLAASPENPNIIYVGLDNRGVYRSTDGGASWQPHRSGLGEAKVRALAVDPLNPQVLYAGRDDGGGVYRSLNGGASWSAFNEDLGSGNIKSLWLDGGSCRALLAGTTNGAWYWGS